MYNRNRGKYSIHYVLAVLLLSVLACSLPNISLTKPEENQTEKTQSTSESAAKLPENVLTEAAATIQNSLPVIGSTETVAPPDLPQAPPIELTNTPTPTLTSTKQPTKTPTKTKSPTTIPPTKTNAPTATGTHTLTPTVVGYTQFPMSPGSTWTTAGFSVKNIHLHTCNGGYAANFKINNRAAVALESLSLKFEDRNTGTVLHGPTVNNAPFMTTDKTCATGGINRLNSGKTLYIGNHLGANDLNLHTIQATIKICTLNSMAGTCFTALLDFVIP